MAIVINVNGDVRFASPKDGKTFNLVELQDYVGGDIEIIHMERNQVMFVNGNGRLLDLPINTMATFLIHTSHPFISHIVGNVIICTLSELDTDDE